ncbi:hypothetical protein [Gemmatimonas sp.]|uniref:hypothetical protein n=1 Tax=Gemmatimonas sp. TaxID=1962908 RepID=UPI0025C380C2|nr:hypothetical protein [Gemmatimonas sp.]MCA2992153.1 hypothetical protein [Gemmatimonas sp.]
MDPMFVEKYEVTFNGRPIANGYASLDRKRGGHKNVSVLPIDRNGVFQDGTLTITLPELITGGYPLATPATAALEELLGMARIESAKVTIRSLTPAARSS